MENSSLTLALLITGSGFFLIFILTLLDNKKKSEMKKIILKLDEEEFLREVRILLYQAEDLLENLDENHPANKKLSELLVQLLKLEKQAYKKVTLKTKTALDLAKADFALLSEYAHQQSYFMNFYKRRKRKNKKNILRENKALDKEADKIIKASYQDLGKRKFKGCSFLLFRLMKYAFFIFIILKFLRLF